MKQLKVKFVGVSPLLMHNGRLANPLDAATRSHKALTSIKKKTDADHEAIIKSEWMGGLYWNEEIGPYIPGMNFDAAFKNAAKLQKLGKQFGQGVMVVEDEVKLSYQGPRDREGMFSAGYLDVRGVKVGMARVMRCRPKFNSWSGEFTIAVNELIVNPDQVVKALPNAGELIGVGDYRPEKGGRYGKFSVEVL